MGSLAQLGDPNLTTHYMYSGNADRAKADNRLLADAKSALPVLKVQKEAAIASIAASPERNAQILQFSTAMPSDAGVSLEVTDQVRGFSNTTHVASDVEIHGEISTIHVEADGF
ncbi:MAG: hypothetical protein JWL77_6133 [Chthonomonadaceae bacterium]|nr:hypothetical protein [Chthonomonadaceae bacterium]